ncbi:transcriptional regulator [Paenibacillus silvae]|uniref:Transcriptional regulator n=1 Tax=Paenibacillus silvae TaxID=1325358 RepID=A0ABQ1ZED3_9BACL|nr:type IV toxin-antitoxin system AbiEi family antitoxin domain-containing protein [Paenibacillus silvae]GGH61517.1 transcriptional regulator [Paenibacillus silvae]
MNEQIKAEAMHVLAEHHGIARTKDFIKAGVSPYHIKKLEFIGEIERIKQGLYRQSGLIQEMPDEMVEVTKLIPKGVICLLSALSYYELTTYNPWEYQIAIHRSSKKPKLPDYPPIKIIYLADAQYNIGIDEVDINGSVVRIYDREKTICDMVRYREKLGMDLMKEGLRNYLKSSNKNITKLVSYADKLRIQTVLQKYLEVLI